MHGVDSTVGVPGSGLGLDLLVALGNRGGQAAETIGIGPLSFLALQAGVESAGAPHEPCREQR